VAFRASALLALALVALFLGAALTATATGDGCGGAEGVGGEPLEDADLAHGVRFFCWLLLFSTTRIIAETRYIYGNPRRCATRNFITSPILIGILMNIIFNISKT
jgi:hypothetical protein